MRVEAWGDELPPDAAAHLEKEAAEFEKSQVQAKADLESLKKELGVLWPLLRLVAISLTLIIAGLHLPGRKPGVAADQRGFQYCGWKAILPFLEHQPQLL